MEHLNKSCDPGWPRRTTSLPLLASTAEELETLPATTYTPPQSERKWSTISEDGETLRLVEARSVHIHPPPSAYRDLVFRTTTPSPPSPLLRRKYGSPNLKDVAVFGDSKRRECFIELKSDVEINIISPTPPTSPRHSPQKKLKLPRCTCHGNKLKRRSLIILPTIEQRRRFSATTQKAKRNSVVLHRKKLPARTKTKRGSALLVPKTRCPNFFEYDKENDGKIDGFPATQSQAHTQELPFTKVYRDILEERWSCYREIDAARAEDEKREVAKFMAKTYKDRPYADHHLHYPPPSRPKSAARSLPLLNTKKASKTKTSRCLTISSPKLFPSWKEMEQAEIEVRRERKKHFWSRSKFEPGDSAKAARNLSRRNYEKEPKKLSKVGRSRLSMLPEGELRWISVYRTDAGLRSLGL